jgi:ABC-type phosphate transport system substrate-binding protein
MSRTLAAPGWGSSAVQVGVLTLITMVLAVVCLTPRASANFTSGKCAGADTSGRGASFAANAHLWFNTNFKINYCAGTPGAGTLDVAYDPAGSGAGRLAVKVRNDTPRFGMTDDPPTTTEIEQMNKGTGNNPPASDANPNDNGKIQVIPAAVGAVAPLVNFPNGCSPEALGSEFRTVSAADISGDSTKKALLRVRFPKAKFEKVWAQGEADAPMVDWDEVFPELTGTAACEVPVIRVVRFDESGTTFAFKDYLRTINEGRGWLTKYAVEDSTALTRKWPGAEYGTGGQCGGTAAPGKQADTTDHLTSGCANGNAFLVQTLKNTDGSIGYSDIATARGEGLAVNPAGPNPPDKYWTQVQNGENEFTEPTANPNGFRTDGVKGANCKETEFKNVPSDTFGNWSPTSGVNSKKGFGICTMTYGLVFEDNAAVWGDTPAEEAKARTVKDYWQSIITDGSQKGLVGADYAPLPSAILAIAKAGIEKIGWKGGTGGPPEGHSDPLPPTGGGGSTPPVKPSNLFSIPRKSISSKTGGATISVKLPGPGRLDLSGTAKVGKKRIKVGNVVLNAGKAGTFNLTLSPSAAAKQQLRRKGRLPVTLTLTFTPTGGDASTTTATVTLKFTKQKKGGRR